MSTDDKQTRESRLAFDDSEFMADLGSCLTPLQLSEIYDKPLRMVSAHALWREARRRGIADAQKAARQAAGKPDSVGYRAKYRRLAGAFNALQSKFVGKSGPHRELTALSCAVYAMRPATIGVPAAEETAAADPISPDSFAYNDRMKAASK